MEEIRHTETSIENPAPSKSKLSTVIAILLAIVAIGAGGAAYIFYTQAQELKANPQKVVQAEIEALLAQIGKLILLPTDEQPTIATVADPEKLKDQVFFANAHKGDKVLIYTKSRKAILYDPVANKIIEVAPVNIGEAPTQ